MRLWLCLAVVSFFPFPVLNPVQTYETTEREDHDDRKSSSGPILSKAQNVTSVASPTIHMHARDVSLSINAGVVLPREFVPLLIKNLFEFLVGRTCYVMLWTAKDVVVHRPRVTDRLETQMMRAGCPSLLNRIDGFPREIPPSLFPFSKHLTTCITNSSHTLHESLRALLHTDDVDHERGEDDDPPPAAVGRRRQVPRRLFRGAGGGGERGAVRRRRRRRVPLLLLHVCARLGGHHEEGALEPVVVSAVLVELLRRRKRARELGVVPPACRRVQSSLTPRSSSIQPSGEISEFTRFCIVFNL